MSPLPVPTALPGRPGPRRRRKHLAADVERLRTELAHARDLAARLAGPSFNRELHAQKNFATVLRDVDPTRRHPARHFAHKLHTYRFAASHGVAVPKVLATWRTFAKVDLSDAPEAFVLKADGGSGSDGVLPLRRLGTDLFQTADGVSTLTADAVLARFQAARAKKSVYGAYFAEELLEQPDGTGIPDDVKVYTAYGRVLQVLLRRVTEHGNHSTVLNKYVSATGADLGPVSLTRRMDPTIPVPDTLPEMVALASHLSRASGLSFVRVDFYNTTRGPVLGEVTRFPGGSQMYVREHDVWMGTQWLEARAELELDLHRGRPMAVLSGSHPADNPYPRGHPARDESLPAWSMHPTSCDTWCHPPTTV